VLEVLTSDARFVELVAMSGGFTADLFEDGGSEASTDLRRPPTHDKSTKAAGLRPACELRVRLNQPQPLEIVPKALKGVLD